MRRAWRFWSLVLALLAVAVGFGAATALTARTAGTSPRVHRHSAPRRLRAGRAVSARMPAGRPQVLPPVVTSGLPRHRVIALTFDDGPGPYTSQVIAELVRLHAPATFFVVGQQLADFGSQLRAELARGFVVGDHTENHAWLIRLDAAGQHRQILDAMRRMRHLDAPRPVLFRPPYGSMNRTTFRVLATLHMTAILWSIDPSDWRRPGTAAIIARVLGGARPGAIVLMHDGGGDRSQTVAALPAIVDGLRRRGYTLVTVPRLLAVDPPPAHPHLPSYVSDR